MQYTTGTVAFTQGQSVAVASADADWTDAKTELDNAKPVWLVIRGSLVAHTVTAITTPASNAGHTPASRWEATIEGVFSEDTPTTEASYVLQWNFTEKLGLPIPALSDVGTAAIIGRAFMAMEAAIPSTLADVLGARAYDTGAVAQSIPNAGHTAITLNSERFDTDNCHSTTANTSRLTCNTAGKYTIVGHLSVAANATGYRQLSIRLNGTDFIAVDVRVAISGIPTQMSIATEYQLAVGDYVEMLIYQTSGAALLVNYVTKYSPEFAMVLSRGTGGGGGGDPGPATDVGQGYEALTFSAAGNQTATIAKAYHFVRVTVGAGTGSTQFNGKLVIPTTRTDLAAGDVCDVHFDYSASTNPTMEARNAASGGSLLFSWRGDGTVSQLWAKFVYSGTAWYLHSQGFIPIT